MPPYIVLSAYISVVMILINFCWKPVVPILLSECTLKSENQIMMLCFIQFHLCASMMATIVMFKGKDRVFKETLFLDC